MSDSKVAKVTITVEVEGKEPLVCVVTPTLDHLGRPFPEFSERYLEPAFELLKHGVGIDSGMAASLDLTK